VRTCPAKRYRLLSNLLLHSKAQMLRHTHHPANTTRDTITPSWTLMRFCTHLRNTPVSFAGSVAGRSLRTTSSRAGTARVLSIASWPQALARHHTAPAAAATQRGDSCVSMTVCSATTMPASEKFSRKPFLSENKQSWKPMT
jgi:hypothetical protein